MALLASFAFFAVALSVSAPRFGLVVALSALPAAQLAITVPLLRPTEYNYFVYVALLTVSVLVGIVLVRSADHSMVPLFFGYVFVSAVVYLGAGQIAAQYGVFVFPLMALCYHELATYADRREMRIVLNGFLVFAGIEAGLGIMQSLVGWPLFFFQVAMSSPRNPLGYLLSSIPLVARQGLGTFAHFNGLGSLLALAVPIAFGLVWQRRTPARWAVLCVTGLGLFTTYSRGAWLGAIIGISAILLAKGSWRWRLGVVVMAGLLSTLVLSIGSSTLSAYYDDTQNVTARLASWQVAVADIQEQPDKAVFGFGYSYYHATVATSTPSGSQAMSRLHSWLVEIPLELGLVGLVLLLVCVLPPPLRALRFSGGGLQVALAGGILGFLVSQLFDNNLLSSTGVFMFMLLGLLRNLQRKESKAP
ncbi:MAG: O-antigen ligase family protein [Thermoleophilia bacterium]|nr:O-antigen ligase family protein [Thermoleophilia bacterium]